MHLSSKVVLYQRRAWHLRWPFARIKCAIHSIHSEFRRWSFWSRSSWFLQAVMSSYSSFQYTRDVGLWPQQHLGSRKALVPRICAASVSRCPTADDHPQRCAALRVQLLHSCLPGCTWSLDQHFLDRGHGADAVQEGQGRFKDRIRQADDRLMIGCNILGAYLFTALQLWLTTRQRLTSLLSQVAKRPSVSERWSGICRDYLMQKMLTLRPQSASLESC
jgi:hypothetical protein